MKGHWLLRRCPQRPVSLPPDPATGLTPSTLLVEGLDCVHLIRFKRQSTPFFALNALRYPEYSSMYPLRVIGVSLCRRIWRSQDLAFSVNLILA